MKVERMRMYRSMIELMYDSGLFEKLSYDRKFAYSQEYRELCVKTIFAGENEILKYSCSHASHYEVRVLKDVETYETRYRCAYCQTDLGTELTIGPGNVVYREKP